MKDSKIFSVLLAILLCFSMVPVEAFADGDSTPPVIGNTVTVSPALAEPGDTVTISVEITDDSEVRVAQAFLYSLEGGTVIYPDDLQRVDNSDIFQTTFEVPATVINGDYYITVTTDDIFGNPSNKQFYDAFAIQNGSSDSAPPVIGDTITVSPAFAEPGDIVTMSVEITDDSEIRVAQAFLYSLEGGAVIYTDDLQRVDNTNVFQTTFEVPVTAISGDYYITVTTDDIFGNPSIKRFYDVFAIQSFDNAGPIISEPVISTAQLKRGEVLGISADITDPSAVMDGTVKVILVPMEAGSNKEFFMHREISTDTFSSSITIPADMALGQYQVKIVALDGRNNSSERIASQKINIVAAPVTPTVTPPPTPTPTATPTPKPSETAKPTPTPQVVGKIDLAKVEPTIANVTWTGKKITPKQFKYNGKTFKIAGNAKITKSGANKNIGKASVTLKGTGNFTGTCKVTFNIVPKKNKVSKVTVGKRTLKVTWKKVSATQNVTKYQVRYRVAGETKWKTKSFSNKNASAILTKLKKGKRYEVQTRSYKTVSKVKYYSDWSKVVKSKKIK